MGIRCARTANRSWRRAGEGILGAAPALAPVATSNRCYQHARTSRAATAELSRHTGTQFDPRVVEALCAHLEQCSHPSAEAVAPVVVSSARS
jgi:hypothetical protein